ncbi:polysaccharide deacetylase family protein [Bacillus salipaludis]|uniref:polysaccharide deacetylase family protein n=1 Tax=Bacillus salipaludis TaxID=2547811 RepID=UPI002E1C882B|nr:polysaccharide deacetylase family protein [Bacillus salipaludis]
MKKIFFFVVLLLMPLFFYQINAAARTTSRFKLENTGQVVWEVNTKEKIVAITFDDGPHPIFTPQILDILAKYNAKATFFVTGVKAKQFPTILKREVNEGHEIANHTYHHIAYNHLTQRELSKEMKETDKTIMRIIGFKPSLFRPVGGHYDNWIVNAAVKNRKLVVIWTWGQDSRDWSNPPVSKICSTIFEGVKPGNILLFHDWHGFEDTNSCKTVDALGKILDYLYKNGYTCVTVSELLYRSTQIIPESFNIFPSKRTQNSQINLMF